jgi:hypothetical protein
MVSLPRARGQNRHATVRGHGPSTLSDPVDGDTPELGRVDPEVKVSPSEGESVCQTSRTSATNFQWQMQHISNSGIRD